MIHTRERTPKAAKTHHKNGLLFGSRSMLDLWGLGMGGVVSRAGSPSSPRLRKDNKPGSLWGNLEAFLVQALLYGVPGSKVNSPARAGIDPSRS